jgi:probable addiction module antidote protein
MKKTTTEITADDAKIVEGDFFEYYAKLLKKDPKQLKSYKKHIVDEYNKNHDTALFLSGLKTIAMAEGMTKLAKKTSKKRANLYKFLSKDNNPTHTNLESIANVLGIGFNTYLLP